MNPLALIPVLGPAVQKLLDLIPDPAARERARAEFERDLLQKAHEQAIAQVDLNKGEAGHHSIFVAGWRPFIGWVCGFALAFQYLARPFWVWGASIWWPGAPVPPSLDGMLWELVFGMLGLGGLRTIEKVRRPR